MGIAALNPSYDLADIDALYDQAGLQAMIGKLQGMGAMVRAESLFASMAPIRWHLERMEARQGLRSVGWVEPQAIPIACQIGYAMELMGIAALNPSCELATSCD